MCDSAPTLILGLPYACDGPLLRRARALGAPVLLSANAFSKRGWNESGRRWLRFQTTRLHLLDGLDAYLDSAGFVATQRYRGYDWTPSEYLDLCAAHPWRWFAAMDFCVEPEIAGDREAVHDRLSMTVASLRECRSAAAERGIASRLMPVVQGWAPNDYARCLDRMAFALEAPLIGVGSICRRPLEGPNGVIAVIERINDELGSLPAKLHLFGVKTDAAAVLASHPRIASYDSQAYGVHARELARKGGFF